MFESIKAKTPQQLWDKHRSEFLRIYASEQGLKIKHSDLEKWFIDSAGKQYYRFPKQMAMPLERMGKLKEFYTHFSAGISGEEMDKLLASMDKILSEGIGKPETASRIGALIHILKERRQFVFHTELLYNILATQAIREDERPDVFSNEIQIEKVAQFKEEVKQSNSYFFFQQTQLTTPIDLLRFSQDEWMELWQESLIQQESFQKMLDLILTSDESKSKTKSSAVS